MTALVRWQPYRETVSLSDVMDRLASRAFARPFDLVAPFWGARAAMPIDVMENADGFTVRASVPGVQPDELDISIENDVVTIRAERKADKVQDEDNVRWQERYDGALERCFVLPAEVDADQVKAELEHGVLTLTLPKAEAAKPKSIKVQAK